MRRPLLLIALLCAGCTAIIQGPAEQDAGAEPDLVNWDGAALYAQNCAACHGPIETSPKLRRTAAQIAQAIASTPEMAHLSTLAAAQVEAIAKALRADPEEVDVVPTPTGRLQFACNEALQAKTPLLKLTNREFQTSLHRLMDDVSTTLKSDAQLTALFAALPSDIATVDRNTRKEQARLVTQLSTTAFFEVAFRAGAVVAGATAGLQAYPTTNGCLAASSLTQACHERFARELGSRAFRRRLTTAEGTALAATLWDAALTPAQQIQSTVAAITLMPDFLYKIYDLGTPVSPGARSLTLTSQELAAKLSYFLTGAPPDATTRSLGESGQLSDATVLSAEVDRLLRQPGARDMVRRLFRESYGYDVYDAFTYAPSYLSGINTSGLIDAMNQELDDYFVEVVLNQNGTFSDLMSSQHSRVTNAGLASIYGVSASGAQLLPASRSGFLNRASMLTKRSGYRASPIKRGLSVLEHVLCVDVGLPPASAPTALPSFGNEVLTTREATARTSEVQGSSCAVCHTRINNLGYLFETFDSLGRERTHERVFDGAGAVSATLPIVPQSTTDEIAPTPQTLNDSTGLSAGLGVSDRAMMCLSQHLKRFESRVATTSADNCQLNEPLHALYGADTRQGSVAEAIKRYAVSEQFRRWSY